ncbi:hypothetical protein ACUXAR_000382 [Staphylococcus saprophyticus]
MILWVLVHVIANKYLKMKWPFVVITISVEIIYNKEMIYK